jgi:transposase-like protein
LAHAPKKLRAEIGADYTDMIYAPAAPEVDAKRRAFLRKWRLKCRAVADSLEAAGEQLFTFLRFPPEQWRSIRTTNAIERLHEEFKRRIKTQCPLPCAATACMLFWADVDIWRSAMVMVKRYGDDAMIEAAARADQLLEAGDWEGCATWHRILDAIQRLQAKAPGNNAII